MGSTRTTRLRRGAIALAATGGLVLGGLTTAFLSPAAAAEETRDYTATQTIPVAPASSFAGSGGGDGWGLVMTPTAVYNVYHHDANVIVACHLQSDASACPGWTSPKVITGPPLTEGGQAVHYSASGQPGMWMDEVTGKFYVYTLRTADNTAGVVCVDTTQPGEVANPFCGFTALTAANEGSNPGYAAVSSPLVIGTKWYAFNYVNAAPATGAQNKLLCFDLRTKAACENQPFALNLGVGEGSPGLLSSDLPSWAPGAIGNLAVVPVIVDGVHKLACFDASTAAACSGVWPIVWPGVAGHHGTPFPMLTQSGDVSGLCVPMAGIPCFDLAGATVVTPPALAATIRPSEPWNGPAVVLGPRIYVPHGYAGWNGANDRNIDEVECYDFNRGEACVNFPKTFTGLSYLYTVNSDPQRPDCLWVNADGGSAQIQNFDAYTGGACGEGALRVLASQLVVPTAECTPNAYKTLQVVEPGADDYTSGSVSFLDASARPIEGASDRPLDENGAVDLTGLDLNSESGLPQFLITLQGLAGELGEVKVQLTWTSSNDTSCRPSTVVTLSPATGDAGSTFTIRYSCSTVPSVEMTRENGTPAPEATLGTATTTNDIDYEQPVQLPAGSYVAVVTCNGEPRTSDVATAVTPPASESPSPAASESPSPTPSATEGAGPFINPPATSPSPTQASGSPSASSPAASPITSPSTAPVRRALRLNAPNQYLVPGRLGLVSAAGEPNAAIELRCYTRPSLEYETVRQVTLDSTGAAEFLLRLPASTRCYARYGEDDSAASPSVVLQVHYAVNLGVTRIGVQKYAFQGSINPRTAGKTVSIWRLGAGRPILRDQVPTARDGSFRVDIQFTGSGTFDFNATTSATLSHASGTSNVVPVTIR